MSCQDRCCHRQRVCLNGAIRFPLKRHLVAVLDCHLGGDTLGCIVTQQMTHKNAPSATRAEGAHSDLKTRSLRHGYSRFLGVVSEAVAKLGHDPINVDPS